MRKSVPCAASSPAKAAGSVGATYSGQVQARYESKLGFQASGRIVARLVEIGSHVKRGQPLMRLDPAQEALQVVAAVASVDAAQEPRGAEPRRPAAHRAAARAQVRLAGRGGPAAPGAGAIGIAAEVGAGAAADPRQPARLHRAAGRPRRRGRGDQRRGRPGGLAPASRSSRWRPTASARCWSACPSRAWTNCAARKPCRSRSGPSRAGATQARCASWRPIPTA